MATVCQVYTIALSEINRAGKYLARNFKSLGAPSSNKNRLKNSAAKATGAAFITVNQSLGLSRTSLCAYEAD